MIRRAVTTSDAPGGERTHREADALHDSIVDLASGLHLPLPIRTRILRELRDDLHGLAAALEERGNSPDEARRRAAETLLPDAEVRRALERQKAPLYRRLTSGRSSAVLARGERWALALATLGLLGLEATALLRAGLLNDPSPFLLPILALGATTLASVAAKAFHLWIKGAYGDPRTGLTAIAVLAALTLFLGFAGVLVDLVVLAGILETTPENATALLTAWLVRSAAALSTAIILAVAGGVGWLALEGWTTHTEAAHQDALRTVLGSSVVRSHQPRSSKETAS